MKVPLLPVEVWLLTHYKTEKSGTARDLVERTERRFVVIDRESLWHVWRLLMVFEIWET